MTLQLGAIESTNRAPKGPRRVPRTVIPASDPKENLMTTEILESTKVGLPDRLDPAQEERAAAFARLERQHTDELTGKVSMPPIQVMGAGMTTTIYSVSMSDEGNGLAELEFSAINGSGKEAAGDYDWVGIFPSTDHAHRDPKSNYLAGKKSWKWASRGSWFRSDVALRPGMVAAYVIKKGDGDYLTVAVTTPWPQKV